MKRSLVHIASAAALVASAAHPVTAQQTSPARRVAAAILQTATVDIASAFQQRYRAMIEPLVFGRFTIGLSGEYTTEPDGAWGDYIAYPYDACPVEQLCTRFTPTAQDMSAYYAPDQRPGYRAWSFDVHARWYPAALSYSGQRQSASVYVGEFFGFHQRRTTQVISYGCPTCYNLPPQPDSAGYVPTTSSYYPPSVYRQVVNGWEPGVEVGVRVVPMRHFVLDVGGRFRLARIDDPQSGTRPGGVDSRLLVSAGVGW